MKKLIIILLCFVSLSANSQNQKIDPTVEVNRDFEGKLMEVHKGKLKSALADSLYNFNVNFNYSFFEKPYKDMYEFAPVESAKVPQLENTQRPEFIAKLGIGYPLAPEAGICYSPELKKGNYLNLWGDLNMYKGEVATVHIVDGYAEKNGEKAENNEHLYGIGGKYTRAWKSGELNLYGKFRGGKAAYYNKITEDHKFTDHRYNSIEGGIEAKSSGAENYGKAINWSANGLIRHTTDQELGKLQENYIKACAQAGPTFGKYNKFLLGIDVEGVQQSGITTSTTRGLFGVSPSYKYENGNLRVNIGIKLQGKYSNTEETEGHHNWILPAVDLLFQILPDNLWLYGKVEGWNNLNPYSSLLEMNRHLSPDHNPTGVAESSVPLHIEGGFKGRYTDKFSYRAYAGYAVHQGFLQFIYNVGSGMFAANTNTSHKEFFAGGELNLHTEKLDGGLALKYSSFTKDGATDVTGIPALVCNVNLGYKFSEKFFAKANCHLQGKYEFKYDATAVVPAFADLKATVGYNHSPALTIWLRGDNILNSATQYYPFYIGRGIGFIAGIIVKL